jgi:DNA-binding PadR family transcriptional regulator
VSSIRLYILGALAEEGEMHGHQLRQLAEKEHVHLWTDFGVGPLSAPHKRLAAEGLIDEVRVEREGSYPERQVWDISDAGRAALSELRVEALRDVIVRTDPFDLAMSRLDRDRLDELPEHIEARIENLRGRLAEREATLIRITRYLTPTEHFVLQHGTDRLRADLAWHERLLERLPELITNEKQRAELDRKES